MGKISLLQRNLDNHGNVEMTEAFAPPPFKLPKRVPSKASKPKESRFSEENFSFLAPSALTFLLLSALPSHAWLAGCAATLPQIL